MRPLGFQTELSEMSIRACFYQSVFSRRKKKRKKKKKKKKCEAQRTGLVNKFQIAFPTFFAEGRPKCFDLDYFVLIW